jgi:hypothetical protein
MSKTQLEMRAKNEFLRRLIADGWTAKLTRIPADIRAVPPGGGEPHFFEIKATQSTQAAFGAATATEVLGALEHKQRYFFVLAQELQNGGWRFYEYSLPQLLPFCTIPPAKIFFSLPLGNSASPPRRRQGTVIATPEKIRRLEEIRQAMS